MRKIVALSGGKDSTALALALKEREPHEYEYVCTPTGNELPSMISHWANLKKILGNLTMLSCGKTLERLILEERCLPNHMMRWCTRILKIEVFQSYVLQKAPCEVFVGIRADEVDREGAVYEASGGVVKRFPFVEWGYGVKDVLDILQRYGICIPPRTDCAFCFYQTTYEWYCLWRDYPDWYSRAEAYESLLQRTFRYQNQMRPRESTWPAALADLRKRFETGEVPKRRMMADRLTMCSTCAR